MSAQQLITDHLDLWTGAVTSRSTAGRGHNGKIELTGLKKLRELILELAVRGKLVEQDPTDEPASVLLERIAEEKARLVEEGKIKKTKHLPEVAEEDKPFELPQGWSWARLGEITNYGSTDKAEPGEVEDTSWVLELEDIEKESSRLVQRITYRERPFKSSKNRFAPGDILYGKLRPYLDKVLVADQAGVCTTEIIPIRAFHDIFSPYLKLALKSPTFKAYANDSTHGMNLPRLGTERARLALIALPPKEQQNRIAEKVDELMALCDRLEQQTGEQLEAHEVLVDALLDALTRSANASEVAKNWARIAEHFDTLFTTEASIDKLKQAILQLAVMGRLVEQDPDDEPASVLLEKIAEEKTRLAKEGKSRKSGTKLAQTAKEIPFHIPDNWEWCKLDDLSLHSAAGWSPQCDNIPRSGNNWGVLKVSAVSWGAFDPDENKSLPSNLDPRIELEIKTNDFLVSRANTSNLVARSVVVPPHAPRNLMMSDKIVRFTLSRKINALYVNLTNNSKTSRDYYSRIAGGTSSSMKNVSRKQIQELFIPLPPQNEQHRIVKKADALIALCDQLKERLSDAGDTRTQLAEAVVEKAVKTA